MIRIKYFASLKSIAGKEEEQMDVGSETTILHLSELISKTTPQIGEMVKGKKIMVSVNQDVAGPDTIVRDGDEVAFLPPFSGGS
ncbi:MAG: molybdopterin converting factor subunit 1 [Nitrospinaceae bacterium]